MRKDSAKTPNRLRESGRGRSVFRVTVLDPARAILRVTGKDRVSWLNSLATCELKNAMPGTAVYGLFVNRVGKIQADAWFCVGEREVAVALPRAVAGEIVAMLDAHLIMEDAVLALDLTQTIAFGGGPYKVARGSLMTQAAVLPWQEGADATVWTAFRMEHGIAEFGSDFDKTLLPHEASLERDAVSFQKGCYLGQEVVCMVELRGQVNKKLVLLESDAALSAGASVKTLTGDDVGTVKSGSGTRAFALVKRVAAENEHAFTVDGRSVHKATLAVPSVPPIPVR
jgi:tRNA-modifying protein YgfZ